jgi:hypothetical protein
LSTSPLVELLPGHTAPELLYLESKLSSLVSHALTVRASRDFLPMDASLSTTSVRRTALRVARRCERELHTQDVTVTRRSRSGQDVPCVVGNDGGYLCHWGHKDTHFSWPSSASPFRAEVSPDASALSRARTPGRAVV